MIAQFRYVVSVRLGTSELSRKHVEAGDDEQVRQFIVDALAELFGVPEHDPAGHGHKPYPSITVEEV